MRQKITIRIYALLLALMLVLNVFPLSVFAETEELTSPEAIVGEEVKDVVEVTDADGCPEEVENDTPAEDSTLDDETPLMDEEGSTLNDAAPLWRTFLDKNNKKVDKRSHIRYNGND